MAQNALPYYISAGIFFKRAKSRPAAQNIFVGLFQSGPANAVLKGVVGQSFNFFFVDFAGVADDTGEKRAFNIVPYGIRRHEKSRELIFLLFKGKNFFMIKVVGYCLNRKLAPQN